MNELSNKIALVTGASRGIGLAIASRFAAEGASVVMCASRLGVHENRPGTLEEAVATINQAGGNAAAVVADLADPEARGDLVARAAESFGPLDILVNSAAGSKMKLPSDGICINTLAPEAIVLTTGADHVRDIAERRPDMVEPVEMMAEAALLLCSTNRIGQVTYSRQLLHAAGRPLKALDGKTIIGDAFTPADLEGTKP